MSYPFQDKAWEIYCEETKGGLDVKDFWNELSHETQQIYLKKAHDQSQNLIGRLKRRANEDRQFAENNRVVAGLLEPQVDAFKADTQGDGGSTWNTYAVRTGIDHRKSAERDAQYASDLDVAVKAIEALLKIAQYKRGGIVVDGLCSGDRDAMIGLARETLPRELWYGTGVDATGG